MSCSEGFNGADLDGVEREDWPREKLLVSYESALLIRVIEIGLEAREF